MKRKNIIELFVYAFIVIVAIILLIQDNQKPIEVKIHSDFNTTERGQNNDSLYVD